MSVKKQSIKARAELLAVVSAADTSAVSSVDTDIENTADTSAMSSVDTDIENIADTSAVSSVDTKVLVEMLLTRVQ